MANGIPTTTMLRRPNGQLPMTVTALSIAIAVQDLLPEIGLPRDVYHQMLNHILDGRREVAEFFLEHWRTRIEHALDRAVEDGGE